MLENSEDRGNREKLRFLGLLLFGCIKAPVRHGSGVIHWALRGAQWIPASSRFLAGPGDFELSKT
jgi:hypothetical protein